MSESSEMSNEQEQELRRRNINFGAGEFEQKNEEESKNLIENISESGSRKQSGDNNETMDSDHVRIK